MDSRPASREHWLEPDLMFVCHATRRMATVEFVPQRGIACGPRQEAFGNGTMSDGHRNIRQNRNQDL